MREMQKYHSVQLLLLMQRVSSPATAAPTERLDNKHQMPLVNRAGKIFSHPTVGQVFEQEASTR